jgi:hypothetical protein
MSENYITVHHLDGATRITAAEWNLLYSTSGATLRAACKGENLPVSGTNADRGRRLLAKGLTPAQVEERYGWRARRGGK